MNPETTATALTSPFSIGRYRIDPARTTVRLLTRHLFGLGAVSGTVRLREADVTVGESLAAAEVHAVLDATSFDSGNPKRDSEVRSAKYLDVATYPDINFDAQEVRQHEGRWVASGTVAAHGIAAPADLTLEELHHGDGGELIVRASATIDRYAHQVTAGKGLAARRLTIEITATLIREDSDE